MPKSQSDRTKMFNLLAGGLDDADLSAPEKVTPESAAPPTVETSNEIPATPPQPVMGDASKQVNGTTDKRKQRVKTGKRSDDAYMQTGMFLPVGLVQEVKGYLAFDGNRQTIGDLTEGLLQVWAAEKKAELAKRLTE
ncbi:MAG: hypothetical protein DCF15_15115 [Phormidesmis priestleyi]|uniref:Uncharacterized protein n=1 Tax=Phormidesmis priestleyi TaxID=268141 RepID=A0A2W4YWB3_9CYAN|nr:MAG: hypothetical protein DCF15_15115 [Phormidesmis priestleyi]